MKTHMNQIKEEMIQIKIRKNLNSKKVITI